MSMYFSSFLIQTHGIELGTFSTRIVDYRRNPDASSCLPPSSITFVAVKCCSVEEILRAMLQPCPSDAWMLLGASADLPLCRCATRVFAQKAALTGCVMSH